jgi:hypothetical protein
MKTDLAIVVVVAAITVEQLALGNEPLVMQMLLETSKLL